MKILEKITSDDGATKFLLGLDDGARVESVFLRLEDNNKDSLCISSQVGCALACRFCSTGVIGYQRDMTADEITQQVDVVLNAMEFEQTRRFDLSYMGMGEPLLNLDAVIASKDRLAHQHDGFNFYLSTVGLAPKIRELADRAPDFFLQISLHAPVDDLRTRIMPINAAHPIAKLLDSGEVYASASGKPVVLNYCLMRGVNDQDKHAVALASLVVGRPFRVQLVNFNPHISIGYEAVGEECATGFLSILQDAGVPAHYGRQLGKDSGAGCGQLDADYAAGQLRRRAVGVTALS